MSASNSNNNKEEEERRRSIELDALASSSILTSTTSNNLNVSDLDLNTPGDDDNPLLSNLNLGELSYVLGITGDHTAIDGVVGAIIGPGGGGNHHYQKDLYHSYNA